MFFFLGLKKNTKLFFCDGCNLMIKIYMFLLIKHCTVQFRELAYVDAKFWTVDSCKQVRARTGGAPGHGPFDNKVSRGMIERN